jgi:23S rRNA-intervening sequence protein
MSRNMEERPKIRGFKDLIVWQKSVMLAVKVYQISKSFPHEEIYGLTSQIRRAVISIPSNIAEGHVKGQNQLSPAILTLLSAPPPNLKRRLKSPSKSVTFPKLNLNPCSTI